MGASDTKSDEPIHIFEILGDQVSMPNVNDFEAKINSQEHSLHHRTRIEIKVKDRRLLLALRMAFTKSLHAVLKTLHVGKGGFLRRFGHIHMVKTSERLHHNPRRCTIAGECWQVAVVFAAKLPRVSRGSASTQVQQMCNNVGTNICD